MSEIVFKPNNRMQSIISKPHMLMLGLHDEDGWIGVARIIGPMLMRQRLPAAIADVGFTAGIGTTSLALVLGEALCILVLNDVAEQSGVPFPREVVR